MPISRRRMHRHLTAVAAAPETATIDDVALLLHAHCVVPEAADPALARIAELRLDAPTVWAWVLREDGIEVARALVGEADDLRLRARALGPSAYSTVTLTT